jgi:hypothetical protein
MSFSSSPLDPTPGLRAGTQWHRGPAGVTGRSGPPSSSRRAGLTLLAVLILALAACGDDGVGVIDPGVHPGTALSPGRSGLPGTSVVQVRVGTVNASSAPGGYLLQVGDQQRAVAAQDTVTYSRMAAGPLAVGLGSMPPGCAVAGDNPRTVEVAGTGLTRVDFQVTCDAGGGLTSAPAGPTTSRLVGPEGAMLEALADDGSRMTLTIPAGALDGPVEISMTPARLAGLPGTVERFVGGAILEPSGLSFRTPATFALAPAGGTAGLLHLLALLADDDGTPEWDLPWADDEGALYMSVPHFTRATLVEAMPGAYVDFFEALGALPEFRGGALDWPIGVEPFMDQFSFCFRLSWPLTGRGIPGAPVFLDLMTDSGRIDDDVVPTGGILGQACSIFRMNPSDLRDPLGEWAVVRGHTLAGLNFQFEDLFGIAVLDPREPVLAPVLPQTPLRSHEPFQLCVLVYDGGTPEAPSSVFSGAVVSMSSRELGEFADEVVTAVTGSDGVACGPRLVEYWRDEDVGTKDIIFEVEALRPSAREWRLDPATSVRQIRTELDAQVEVGPWDLRVLAPSVMTQGEVADICAEVLRGEVPVNELTVAFWRRGAGVLEQEEFLFRGGEQSPGTSGITGFDGPGRVCVTFEAPEEAEDDESTTIDVDVDLLFASRATSRIITYGRQELTLTADPGQLNEAGATSQVCALLVSADGEPVPGVPVTFRFVPPGALDWDDGAVTGEDGRVCATYTAPTPFPSSPVEVTIAAAATGTGEASTTIRLGDPYGLTLSASPTSLLTAGSTSQVCAFLQDLVRGGGAQGTAVTFSTAGPGGVFPNSVVTNTDGRACTTFTAPSPMPSVVTDVTITGVATPDGESLRSSATVRLSTTAPLAILTTTLPQGLVDGGYTTDILAGGGTGFRTWSLVGGSLPPGLAFSQVLAQGRIAGVPSTAGEYSFTLRVATSTESVEQAFTIVVREPSGGGGGGGGGGTQPCAVVVGEYPGGGNYTEPPFSLQATVGGACGSGVEVSWAGGTRNNTGVTITEIPGFSIESTIPLQTDPDNAERLVGFARVTYDRNLFLSPLYPQREGFVRTCLSRNGEPILNEFGDQVCATYRWFN